jgi:hypothetical protein
MVKECNLKFKCLIDKYGALKKNKIYTCHEESTLFEGVYFVKGENNIIVSVGRVDKDLIFFDDLDKYRKESIDDILN